jgi:anti-sigma-K factor RskA
MVMSSELDPDLKRLFAQTAEHPADAAFVSAVTARTSRDGRTALIAWRLAGAVAAAVALGALGLALEQSVQLITPLVSASPAGLAYGLGLAIAGAVCVRLIAPLVSLGS